MTDGPLPTKINTKLSFVLNEFEFVKKDQPSSCKWIEIVKKTSKPFFFKKRGDSSKLLRQLILFKSKGNNFTVMIF